MARRRDKGQEKRVARARVNVLLRRAEGESSGPDRDLADRYVELAGRVARRYQTPLRPVRNAACQACGRLRTPTTSRTRLHRGRVIITCHCGHVRRRPL